MQQEPPANPPVAPQSQPETLTEQEYAEVVALARQHRRTVNEVQVICGAMGVPVLERAPRSRLDWLKQAMQQGLVKTADVDRISQLVEALKLDWAALGQRLRERYQVSSIAHLLPGQLEEIEKSLQAKLAANAQTQPGAVA